MSHLSHEVGQSEPPLLDITIGQALERAADQWGGADAVVSVAQGVRWTWRELARRADEMAAGLLALGLERGDRIGIWSPTCAEWALTQFASARIGLILTTINPAYRATELAFTIGKVGMKAVVAAQSFKSSDYVALLDAIDSPTLAYKVVIGGAPRAGWIAFGDLPALATARDRQRVRELGAALDCRDPINIQFTSGTTGLPKGATLSHRNILNNGWFVGRAQRLAPGDRICVPVPLYHCFGMVMGNLTAVTCGATVVYPAAAFDPAATLAAIAQERCTALYGVPTMFIAELECPDFATYDLSSLRTGIMAGSPCPIEVMTQVIERMHLHGITIAYGMTETSPVSFQSAVDDPVDRRVSTIGRVHPHLEVKVVDPDGATTARGVPGELCTRGYSVMLGYWGDPAGTAQAIDADGWMHTGDIGTIDEHGYGSVVGRIKDMVIRGGENIYPAEVEACLLRHPAIADAAVFGLPDAFYGEKVCAWVRCREPLDPDAIIDWCKGQIAHQKVPAVVRVVEAFPMTVTGKVQKFAMREAECGQG